MGAEKKYKTLKSFYPYYLTGSDNTSNRLLHFLSALLLLACFASASITGKIWLFGLVPFLGYGFARAGDLFVERNLKDTLTASG